MSSSHYVLLLFVASFFLFLASSCVQILLKAKCFFSIGFFLLHLPHFLQHGSIQSVVCPKWSLFEVQHHCGINSQPWKKPLEITFTARGSLNDKIPAAPSVGPNYGYKCNVWGKKIKCFASSFCS